MKQPELVTHIDGEEVVRRGFRHEFATVVAAAIEAGVIFVEWYQPADPIPDIDEAWFAPLQTEPTGALLWAENAVRQVGEYFDGRRTVFDVPLVLYGTPFQRAVWQALQEIPYGRTWSYGDVARHIERPKAVRAVGQANRANPVSIIVPCHRVIGASGALTGYSGTKVHMKAALLDLERQVITVPARNQA